MELFDAGLYLLVVQLRASTRLQVGALGPLDLPAGWYCYAGSGRRALHARVARHLRRRKRKHWHIDYLTTSAAARATGAVLLASDEASECQLGQGVGARLGLSTPAPHFGASDCRSGCAAHLYWRRQQLSLSSLALIIDHDRALGVARSVIVAASGGRPQHRHG